MKALVEAIQEGVADSNEFANDQFSHATDAYDAGVADAIEALREYFGE